MLVPDDAIIYLYTEITDMRKSINTLAEHTRKKHPKRTQLPDHLPRETIGYDITDAEKRCGCGCQKECFGEEVTEQLDIIPMQLKVLRHVRPKYVCKQCKGNISVAPMPSYPNAYKKLPKK